MILKTSQTEAPRRVGTVRPVRRATGMVRPTRRPPNDPQLAHPRDDRVTASTAAPWSIYGEVRSKLFDILNGGQDDPHTLSEVLSLVLDVTDAPAAVYMQRDKTGRLSAGPSANRGPYRLGDSAVQQLKTWSDSACKENRLLVKTLDADRNVHVVAVPVMLTEASPEGMNSKTGSAASFMYDGAPSPSTSGARRPGSAVVPRSTTHTECLCVVLSDLAAIGRYAGILCLVAADLAHWRVRGTVSRAEWEAATAAALVELLSRMMTHDKITPACYQLVHDLQKYMDCQYVAVGLIQRGNCRLQALAGLAEFDRRAEIVCAVESAMDESVSRDAMTIWPADSRQLQATSESAHQRLADLVRAGSVVSLPLKDIHGRRIGACLFWGDDSWGEDPRRQRVIRAAAPRVAGCLSLIRRQQRGRLVHLAQSAWRGRRTWQVRAAASCIAAMLVMLLLPWPYKVSCNATLQPVVRRFVAAPFDGVLQRTLCKPGRLVTAGEPLAQLDGREIRMELAGLVAEHQRLEKERQVALATHDTAVQQQAELKMERLQLKIGLLEYRQHNLLIRSPIDGVVIRGDLENAVGVPVSTGQTLFEIGPLDEMLVEISIPDEELRHVRVGRPVKIRLDAEPGVTHHAKLSRIHPSSEVIDGQNVFVGELMLENSQGGLRPGMSGRAVIVGPRRPLAWNLFHKPWYFIVRAVSG